MKMEFVKTFQHWTRGIMTALACVAVLGIPVTAQAVESSSPQALQQQRTVKGKVIDETGEPMIGVTVKVEGAIGGAITDLDGNFTVAAPSGVLSLPPRMMSVPRPAMLVAMVTVPSRPALATISASLMCCLAFSTSCLMPLLCSIADRISDFSTEMVPTSTG